MKLFPALVSALVVLGGIAANGTQLHGRFQFRGSVVGYDEATSLMNLTSAPQIYVVIVRADHPDKGKVPEFSKVVFVWFHGERELPPDFFESGHQWRFSASAIAKEDSVNNVCDARLLAPQWLDASAAERIGDLAALKCFESSPIDVKRQ